MNFCLHFAICLFMSVFGAFFFLGCLSFLFSFRVWFEFLLISEA
jgi:hypothetical protein